MRERSPKTADLVLDSWAVLAWLADEPAARRVAQIFDQAATHERRLFLSTVNAGEVYYRHAKHAGPDRAEDLLRDLRRGAVPVRLVGATHGRVWRAARLKARHPVAYADAFAAALAKELDLPVLTGDPDFAILERSGECRVEWLASHFRR